MKLVTLFLTCADREEAHKITDDLLDKKLAACVRITDVESAFLWHNKKETSAEALLMIETEEEKFEAIEKAVRQLHSYETFVLSAVPVIKTSEGVVEWIERELK